MTDNIFEMLEKCLQSLATGMDVETILSSYPQYAADLRPLLLASLEVRSIADTAIPPEVAVRVKTRVMAQAAEMRSAAPNAAIRRLIRPLKFSTRFLTAALVAMMILVGGGTGLVVASNNSIPGDQLYIIKRGWEKLRLGFAFNSTQHLILVQQFEQERLDEIEHVFDDDRQEKVSFKGPVESQSESLWFVAGIAVTIDQNTLIFGTFVPGDWVKVTGITHPDDKVSAISITSSKPSDQKSSEDRSGQSGSKNDTNDDRSKDDKSKNGDQTDPSRSSDEVDDSGSATQLPSPNSGSDHATPESVRSTPQPSNTSQSKSQTFDVEGTIDRIVGRYWTVKGLLIYIDPLARVDGNPQLGAEVRLKGFYGSGNTLIATSVEIKNSQITPSSSGSEIAEDDD